MKIISESILTHTCRETIDEFSSTLSTLATFVTTGMHLGPADPSAPLPLPTKNLPDKPNAVEKPTGVNYWYKKTYEETLNKQKKETDVLATQAKRRRGRPARSDKDENSSHPYLEAEDGTPVSKDLLRLLSQKARRAWSVLLEKRRAPAKWSSISTESYDYYIRTMLNDDALKFLLYCNDGEWKLAEWSKKSYSSWAMGAGIREAGTSGRSVKKEKVDIETLDDPSLLKMSEGPDDVSDINAAPNAITTPVNASQDEVSLTSGTVTVFFQADPSHLHLGCSPPPTDSKRTLDLAPRAGTTSANKVTVSFV
jgi:hypothetical protein